MLKVSSRFLVFEVDLLTGEVRVLFYNPVKFIKLGSIQLWIVPVYFFHCFSYHIAPRGCLLKWQLLSLFSSFLPPIILISDNSSRFLLPTKAHGLFRFYKLFLMRYYDIFFTNSFSISCNFLHFLWFFFIFLPQNFVTFLLLFFLCWIWYRIHQLGLMLVFLIFHLFFHFFYQLIYHC